MTELVQPIENIEILFIAEGHSGHHSAQVEPGITVGEFIEVARTKAGIEELVDIYLENAEEPLRHDLLLAEQLTVNFAPIHVATKGKIKTTVRYQTRDVERAFGPAITIAMVTSWAVEALKLQGDPSDFQLKLGSAVLAPGDHLGQIAKGKKELTLELVFKVKPQG